MIENENKENSGPDEDKVDNFPQKKNKGAVVLEISDGNVSLQEQFKKFRAQKLKERQILMASRNELLEGKRTQQYKDNLRAKFIETAKKYLGVPYAERFKAPDAPVAPLYLDCCGLVRQAVKDLTEEFGFVIGRWNQCYQMDTLPIVLKQEELRPGDLIFYEGIYNSNRSKPQKHNNVHVEIFLGGETGEATIGSRYHKGVVSIFPSFKFKSTTWDLVQYHFRSIDTWLEGHCKSCCDEHPWTSDALAIAAACGRRSIFNDDNDVTDSNGGGVNKQNKSTSGGSTDNALSTQGDEDSDDVDAGGWEGVDEDEQGGGEEGDGEGEGGEIPTNQCSACVPQLVSPTKSAEPSLPLPKPSPSSSLSSTSNSTSPSKGKALSNSMPELALSETSTTTAPPPVDDPKSKPLNGVVGRRSRLASKPAANPSSEGAKGLRASASTADDMKKTTSQPPKTYYVCKSNGWKLVKAALDKRGWQQLPFEYQFSSRFSLKWVERRSQIDYKAHLPGQLVCHIPNNDVITTKHGLTSCLREMYCQTSTSSSSSARIPTPWMPETYQLDSPADVAAALAVDDEVAAKDGKGPIWIYKPSLYNRGRGIKLLAGKDALSECCLGKNTGNPETSIPPLKGIVQRYIENPLLVGNEAEGFKKFDIRCYMLIARTSPTYLVFYHPGYCRLSLKPYSADIETLSDTTIHLTNASVQKKDAIYEGNKEKQIQTLAGVADQLDAQGKTASANFMRHEIDNCIKKCMVDVFKSAAAKFSRKPGYFDLLGFDFMVTDDNQLKLLECNTNPAMSLDNSTLEALLPGVIDGTIDLVLSTQGPDRPPNASDDAILANLPFKFELIHNEATGFWWN